jgi:hypothetical protein
VSAEASLAQQKIANRTSNMENRPKKVDHLDFIFKILTTACSSTNEDDDDASLIEMTVSTHD